MKNIKKVAVSASAAALAGLMAIGGASIMAYLTDSETTTNTFTVGKVTVDLEEPNYPGNGSDEVTNLVPNEEVRKDPLVENTGDNKLVSFLKVYSPIALVSTVNDNGSGKTALGPKEIFYMKQSDDAITAHQNNFYTAEWDELTGKETAYVQAKTQADGTIKYETVTDTQAKEALWAAKFFHLIPQEDGKVMLAAVAAKDIAGLPADEKVYTMTETQYNAAKEASPNFIFANAAAIAGMTELQRGDVQTRLDNARIYKTYVFGHKTDLDPKEKSHALFDKVQLANIVEGEIDTREQNLILETYAIQSENILDTAAIDTSGTISNANLGKIYDIFVNQATAGRGDEAESDMYKNVEHKDANITPTKDLNGNMADVTTKRIELSIADAKIQVGENVSITPTASENGQVKASPEVTYSSDNTAIATVDSAGIVHGVAIGTTYINGTWEGATAKIEVTVVNPEPTTP